MGGLATRTLWAAIAVATCNGSVNPCRFSISLMSLVWVWVWVWVNKKADYFRNPALASRSAIGVRIYTIRLEGRFLHVAIPFSLSGR
jgi:hypothetical protein